ELRDELLMQGSLRGNRNFTILLVGIVVAVSLHLVSTVLIIKIVVQIEVVLVVASFILIRILKVILLALLGFIIFPFFQSGIYFQLFFYPCVQLCCGHL